MSSTSVAGSLGAEPSGVPDVAGLGPQPRVRHLAREAAVLMTFSAATSCVLACCLLVLTSLGRQG